MPIDTTVVFHVPSVTTDSPIYAELVPVTVAMESELGQAPVAIAGKDLTASMGRLRIRKEFQIIVLEMAIGSVGSVQSLQRTEQHTRLAT